VQTATAYLEVLNPEQRRAVEHGAAGGLAAPPLLVIARAGSGKTNTLAHLIVQGADPRRILLMTFSRRAASETTKRVERIARKVMGDNAGIMTDALTWDRRNQSLDFMQANFGKAGLHYYWISRGIDDREVRANRIRKSVGAENTFANDLTEFEVMLSELQPLIRRVGAMGARRSSVASSRRSAVATLACRHVEFPTSPRTLHNGSERRGIFAKHPIRPVICSKKKLTGICAFEVTCTVLVTNHPRTRKSGCLKKT
jgi:hypothetical protein